MKRILFICAFISASLQAFATTYYVSNTGSDAANGTSTGTPWQTISKVNGTSFVADDIILFKRGNLWREQLTVPTSGTSGHPITFGAYDFGSKPLINGADVVTGWVIDTGTVYKKTSFTYDPTQVFEDSIRLIHSVSRVAMVAGSYYYDSGAATLYVWTTKSTDPSNYTIEVSGQRVGIHFNGKAWIVVDSIHASKSRRNGFNWQNVTGSEAAGAHDIVVTNAESSWNALRGFGMGGYFPLDLSNIAISNSYSHDNLGEGFWLGNGTNLGCDYCTAYANGNDRATKGYTFGDGGGVLIGIHAVNNYVTHSRSYGNGFKSAMLVEYENNGTAIAFGSAGASQAGGTTSIAVPYPAVISEGDLLVIPITNKYPTNGPSTPSGWTVIASNQATGGAGAPGAGSGTVYATIFIKIANGNESGNVTVSIPSGNAAVSRMIRVTKDPPATWSYLSTTGAQNSAATSWSITGTGSLDFQAGDQLYVFAGGNTNAGNFTAETATASGITFGSQTERVEASDGSGDDTKMVVSSHTVTAGSGTVAPSYTATTSSAAAGAAVFLRLRETYSHPSNSVVAYNTFEAASTPGNSAPLVTQGSGSAIYYNIVTGSGSVNVALARTENTSTAETFYNNVFYQAGNNWCMTVGASVGASGTVLKNNVFNVVSAAAAAAFVGVWALGQTGFVSDYNDFYDSAAPGFWYWEMAMDEFPTSLSGWRTASGGDSHSIASNPLFVNPTFKFFQPKAGSPLIDAGIDVGLMLDKAGNPIVPPPDIGAYEYTGSRQAMIAVIGR